MVKYGELAAPQRAEVLQFRLMSRKLKAKMTGTILKAPERLAGPVTGANHMAEKKPNDPVSTHELAVSNMIGVEALVGLLIKKGLITYRFSDF
jgi:hypothetical protein